MFFYLQKTHYGTFCVRCSLKTKKEFDAYLRSLRLNQPFNHIIPIPASCVKKIYPDVDWLVYICQDWILPWPTNR